MKVSLIPLCICCAASCATAQEQQITIKLQNIAKKAIAGTVYLNPGYKPFGTAKADGTIVARHKCETGQTFKAEPAEGEKYTHSSEELCEKSVVLLVLPRLEWTTVPEGTKLASGPEDTVFFRDVSLMPGVKAGYYAVLGGFSDKTESLSVEGKDKCKLTISKRLKLGYLNTESSRWVVTEPGVDVPKDKLAEQTYLFQTSCADSASEIANIKRRTQSDVRDVTKDYFNNVGRTVNANPDFKVLIQKFGA